MIPQAFSGGLFNLVSEGLDGLVSHNTKIPTSCLPFPAIEFMNTCNVFEVAHLISFGRADPIIMGTEKDTPVVP